MKMDAQLLAAEFRQTEARETQSPTRPWLARCAAVTPAGQRAPAAAMPPPWALALSAQLQAVQAELAGLRAELDGPDSAQRR